MTLIKKAFYAIGVPLIAYGVVDYNLFKKYNDIRIEELPNNMKIKRAQTQVEKENYVPYCDTFMARIELSENQKFEDIAEKLLFRSTLKSEGADKIMPRKFSTSNGGNWYSTLLHWQWRDMKLVDRFENFARLGYPYRLMSGGFHEFYIEKVKGKVLQYDVYFATAHEYRDLGDDKIIPKCVNRVHLTYGRLLFWYTLLPWKEINVRKQVNE